MPLGHLKRSDEKDFNACLDAAQRAYDALHDALPFSFATREEVDACIAQVRPLVEQVNGALSDLADIVERLAEEMQDQFDSRSERWQESDRGQEVSGMVDEWTNVSRPDDIEVVVDGDADYPLTVDEVIDIANVGDYLEEVSNLSTEV